MIMMTMIHYLNFNLTLICIVGAFIGTSNSSSRSSPTHLARAAANPRRRANRTFHLRPRTRTSTISCWRTMSTRLRKAEAMRATRVIRRRAVPMGSCRRRRPPARALVCSRIRDAFTLTVLRSRFSVFCVHNHVILFVNFREHSSLNPLYCFCVSPV
jgi:hypothetical protein